MRVKFKFEIGDRILVGRNDAKAVILDIDESESDCVWCYIRYENAYSNWVKADNDDFRYDLIEQRKVKIGRLKDL